MSSSSFFDEYYYEHGCGRPYERDEGWLNFFDTIAKRLVQESEPRTVLDAGCVLGFLVEAFRNHGVEAFGIDISTFAIENVLLLLNRIAGSDQLACCSLKNTT